MRENDKGTRLSCAEVRDFDMVCYLEQIGILATRIKGNDYWYLSPLRNEKTPSFKINRRINRWFDFGLGQGGNLIDFALLYFGCSIPDFLRSFTGNTPGLNPANFTKTNIPEEPEAKVIIQAVGRLHHPALLSYLNSRCIPNNIAVSNCLKVQFEIKGRSNFAIGFPNRSGGFELRNKYFKGSSSPKDYTLIKNGSAVVSVVEGFIDFLSHLVLFPEIHTDFIILNSLALFNRAREVMDNYHSVDLYLDNNPAGQNCTRLALALSSLYNDQSHHYKNYEDLNDFLRGIQLPATPDPLQKYKPP